MAQAVLGFHLCYRPPGLGSPRDADESEKIAAKSARHVAGERPSKNLRTCEGRR